MPKEMTEKEALEIVLEAAKQLQGRHSEIVETPHKFQTALDTVETMIENMELGELG